GDFGCGRELVATVEVGNDRAGRTDGLVDEENGLGGVKGAEAVVIDDLGDRDLVGTGDGLGHLVVVDEDEVALHGAQDVGLGEDAGEAAVVVEHHEGGGGGDGELAVQVGEAEV